MIIKTYSHHVNVDAIAMVETHDTPADGDVVLVHLTGGQSVYVPWRAGWWERWLKVAGPVVD